jgi:LPS O-antigen subunit length determinant protein (WzzB/FepE family)
MEERRSSETEIDLVMYWRILIKRRSLIAGIMLVSMLLAAGISFLMPKTYRGDVTLSIRTRDIVTREFKIKDLSANESGKELTAKELLAITGDLDDEKLKTILPKTHMLLSDIKIVPLIKDSDDKVKISVEAKVPKDIPVIFSEIIEYLNSNPMIGEYITQQRELLKKQSEELSMAIESLQAVVRTFETLSNSGRLVTAGFNPVELYAGISKLKIEKFEVEQSIKNLKGVELIEQHVSNRPVRPKKILTIILAGAIGLLIGIGLALITEYGRQTERQA